MATLFLEMNTIFGGRNAAGRSAGASGRLRGILQQRAALNKYPRPARRAVHRSFTSSSRIACHLSLR
jgi:hypothetical protein